MNQPGPGGGAGGPVGPVGRRPAGLLAIALGALAAAQVGWILLNHRPIEYDSAWYLEVAIQLRRALLEQGPTAFLEQARAAFGFKAPGVSMAAALVMALGGEALGVALAVSLAAWLLAAAYLYLLARRLLSAEAAALAALLASTMPMAFALARSLLVESALTAAVVAFLFHAAASERLRRPGHLAALVAWGAAGLMVKVTFPVYVVVPALLLTLAPWREARPRLARILGGWGLVTVGACGAAWWLWYGANWRALLEYTRSAGFGALSEAYAVSIPTFLGAALLHAAAPTLVLALPVLAMALRRGDDAARGGALLLALSWVVPPLLMVLSSSNRYGRYLAAALPGLSLAVAALAEPWLRRGGRTSARAWGLLAGPPLLAFIVATLPTPLAGAVRGWVEAPWLGSSVNWYEGPPDRRPWPNTAIVETAARASGSGGAALLRLNVDLPELNHNNLKVEALRQRTQVVPAQIDQRSPEGALVTAFDGDLLLVQVEGEVASDFLNVQRAVVLRELASRRQPYRELARFDLPGGRRLALLERRCAVAPAPGAVPLAVLQRGVDLVELEVGRPVDGLVRINARYRLADGSQALLAVSVELVDGAGRVLGAGEHPVCRRPLGPRPAGLEVELEDSFFLPPWVVAPGVGLRLGLRDLRSGAPLLVERVGAGLARAGGKVEVPRLGERLSGAER